MDRYPTEYQYDTGCPTTVADAPVTRNIAGAMRRLLSVSMIIMTFLGHVGRAASPVPLSMDRMIPIPHPMTTLVRAEDVQQELGLSTVQVNEVKRAVENVELPLWRLRDVPVQERNNAAGLLVQQLQQNLERIISRQQLERLNQLARQAEGISVILEPEMVLKLGLSAEQIEHIRMALNISYNKLVALQRDAEDFSESRKAASIRIVHDETEKSIIAVLNGFQQRALRKLMGEPFDLSNVRIVACKAPEFDVDTWINPPESDKPERAGKVTVIHFYAFGCDNCIRTLPYYNEWREHFPPGAFQVIGIHRPETEQEREIDRVKAKAVEAGMKYPIAIDNDSLMWDAWANRIWPSIYLIDKKGYVRYWWYGELNWQGAESEKYLRGKIQELIQEKSVVESTDSAG